MAVPFRRVSKMKKGMRRSHQELIVPCMIVCPNCGELTLAHRVCSNCGYYKGKAVVVKATEENAE